MGAYARRGHRYRRAGPSGVVSHMHSRPRPQAHARIYTSYAQCAPMRMCAGRVVYMCMRELVLASWYRGPGKSDTSLMVSLIRISISIANCSVVFPRAHRVPRGSNIVWLRVVFYLAGVAHGSSTSHHDQLANTTRPRRVCHVTPIRKPTLTRGRYAYHNFDNYFR